MKTQLNRCFLTGIVFFIVTLESLNAFGAPPGFVYREGINFMLNGKPYYFAGANCYDLFTFGDGSNTSTTELIESHFMDKRRIDAHLN